MMGNTHMLVGFMTALFTLPIVQPQNQILYVFVVVFGALLPDIDHPQAKLGRYVKPLAYLAEHRGFFHSVWMLAIWLGLAQYFIGSSLITWGLFFGFLSHQVIDSFSVMGLMPFHPLSKLKFRGFIHTGDAWEKLFFVAIIAVSMWKLYIMGF